MRSLGVDYGSKRVGIAISDEGNRLAFPFKILMNNPKLLDEIHNICGEQSVGEIVIGESLDFSGKQNDIMNEIKKFKSGLKELNLPVHLQKEFLTTIEARGREGKEINNAKKTKNKKIGKVDASAAALILQRFLDKKNKEQKI